MRNLERKRERDRVTYNQKRKDNPAAIADAERLRKAKQRSRKRDIETRGDHGAIPIDSTEGRFVVDQQQYKNWQAEQFRD